VSGKHAVNQESQALLFTFGVSGSSKLSKKATKDSKPALRSA